MIAREGLPFILVALGVAVGLAWAELRWDSWWLLSGAALFLLLTLFIVFFFRDPRRHIEAEPNQLLSPADGKILGIETIENHQYIGGDALKISVFLSIFDVHINRMPATGRIDYVRYNPGKFFSAFKDKASELNEHNEIGMTTSAGFGIVLKQIAGVIARRIVCRAREGDIVKAGAKFGMIRFGSRVELFVPVDIELQVKQGDHVKAGLTVLGTFPQTAAVMTSEKAGQGENAKL
ncbi:MAG: phosphatidylserine decarboxylase family protein [Candidatus Zixiibacteriota bacterium]